MISMPDKLNLTVAEAHALFVQAGVPIKVATVRRMCKKGTLGRKIGGRYYVRPDEVRKLIEG